MSAVKLMMILEGKVAISYFIAYILLVLAIFRGKSVTEAWPITTGSVILGLSLFVTLFVPYSSVARRASMLGSVFGIALLLSSGETKWKYCGWYFASLSFFHFSEYVMVAKYCPDKLSTDSFLLNHSPEYQIAAVASWVEFVLEWWLFPQVKNTLLLSFLGLLMMVGGEILRKLAMITAESNFTHHIQTRKERGHVLVTHGIYSLCRHPGYAGWFWWSIGTQITLANPICLVAYVWASWKFFNDRIHDEEMTLCYFFGDDYLAYQEKVTTVGVPFVKGFDFTPETVDEL